MSEELLINVDDFETRVALLSDGALQEIHIARSQGYSLTGNIYLGKVERIIPGMQAAFVNVGLARPGFLHARDIERPRKGAEQDPPPDIRNLLHDGQELLVQVAKDPIASKGARLTTQLAIASRYLVLLPFNDHIGISQRIEEESERERLHDLIDGLRCERDIEMGFIVRTASEGVDEEPLQTDVSLLARMWDRILENRAVTACPGVVYQELPLHIRVVRDLASANLQQIHIDDEDTYQRVLEFVDAFLPEFSERVVAHVEPRPLFERHGIDDEVTRALQPKMSMKCGGYLIIEQTEAMTTIDVNTGSYLGVHSLEETVFRTNLEAAQIIPRQLRLRNLGGIIVIDFIDMEDEEHQRQVLRMLEKAVELDPARVRIEGFSSLGLVQMSRKRTRKSLAQQVCEPCHLCNGIGLVKTSESTCIEVFRAILHDAGERCEDLGQASRRDRSEELESEYLIRASESVVDRLLDEDAEQLAELSERTRREIRIQVEPSYGPGQFDVVVVRGTRR